MGSVCCVGRFSGTPGGEKSSSKSSVHASEQVSVPPSTPTPHLSSPDSALRPAVSDSYPSGSSLISKDRIRLIAKSLILDIPIASVQHEIAWFSPITCKGALFAVEFTEVIRLNSGNVAFRGFVKEIVIEEQTIDILIGNFSSGDASLRRVSVYLLSFLIVESQFEIMRLFMERKGVRKLKELLKVDSSEGLAATAMDIATGVFAADTEFQAEVCDFLPVLVRRLGKMQDATFIQQTLENLVSLFSPPPAVPALLSVLRSSGLPSTLQEMHLSHFPAQPSTSRSHSLVLSLASLLEIRLDV